MSADGTLEPARISNEYDILSKCIHCGLCLPHCPTYALSGLERSSPRGRIRLMKYIDEGELSFSPMFKEEMEFCLDCQACETACPAGVKYGELVERARAQLYIRMPRLSFRRIIQNFFFRHILPVRRNLTFVASILRWLQATGIFRLLSGFLKHLSTRLTTLVMLTPEISLKYGHEMFGERELTANTPRYRVGLFLGCVMNVAYAEVHRDTVALLRQVGCNVVIPTGQTCCGSLQAHYGDQELAKSLVEENMRLFSNADIETIIVNSAGCGAFMKRYHRKVSEGNTAKGNMEVKDLTEFLVEVGFGQPRDGSNWEHEFSGKRVAWHDPCHLAHAQGVVDQPRKLLQQIPGIQFVPLSESSWCCGSAGIYNIIRPKDAALLLERKLRNIKRAEVDILVTANPGCEGQLRYGVRNSGLNTEVIHIASFLAKIYAEKAPS